MKILRHLISIVVLPLTVTLLVPRWLAISYGVEFIAPATLTAKAMFVLGVAVLPAGVVLAVWSVLRFFFDGDGTLAPWDPPRRFVVTGPYRYVRNPMISGVCLVLIAQALVFRSPVLAAWAAAFILMNVIYIPLIEEPGLDARFGEPYREYCRHVGRLIPRVTPYVGANSQYAGPSFGSASLAGLKSGSTYERLSGHIIAVVPASGESRRFGSDKRKALIEGVPMLQRVVRRLEEAGARRVIVIDNNPDPGRGMFSSIQIGLAEAVTAGADVILVQPADMPFVREDTIRLVAAECARTGRAVCPRFNGRRGHPLAFPLNLARQLLAVAPSTPLNEAFASIGLTRHEIEVDDPGVLRDVDTPDDLNTRASTPAEW